MFSFGRVQMIKVQNKHRKIFTDYEKFNIFTSLINR